MGPQVKILCCSRVTIKIPIDATWSSKEFPLGVELASGV